MQDHGKLNANYLGEVINVGTPNRQDTLYLFSIAVIYNVSLHLCNNLSVDQYNK